MKRAGNLWGRLVEKENLRYAFYRAARGKWVSGRVREFSRDLEVNLQALSDDLQSGSVSLGRYHSFEIREPKLRMIHAAHFEERVVHHALMAVVEPIFERAHVDHTYACRVGKGRLAALQHSRKCAASQSWFLKGDVRKYFDSIPHEGVMDAIQRKIKDRRVVEFFQQILGSYETSPGRGLPIGSLTSQHLANLYLAPLDRLVMEQCKLRYMRGKGLWTKLENGHQPREPRRQLEQQREEHALC